MSDPSLDSLALTMTHLGSFGKVPPAEAANACRVQGAVGRESQVKNAAVEVCGALTSPPQRVGNEITSFQVPHSQKHGLRVW